MSQSNALVLFLKIGIRVSFRSEIPALVDSFKCASFRSPYVKVRAHLIGFVSVLKLVVTKPISRWGSVQM